MDGGFCSFAVSPAVRGMLNIMILHPQVRWSMLHGKGIGALKDEDMAKHGRSEEHTSAHLFFATPDKLQWAIFAAGGER